MKPGTHVRFEKHGAVLAVIAVLLVSIYQTLFFYGQGALAVPLWAGSALTLAFLLGVLSLIVPITFAWWMIAGDKTDGERFESSDH